MSSCCSRCSRHEELRRVERRRGDRAGGVGPEEGRVLVLDRVRARGLRDDDRAAGLDRGRERFDVALRRVAEPLRIAGVEPGHPAADLTVGQIAREAVALEHADHRLADLGGLVLDEARREQRDALTRRCARRRLDSRPRNHFENRTRANVGSSRTREMPVTFSISTRAGFNFAVAFTIGANVVAIPPCRSVRASMRAEPDFCLASGCAISDRSISCGKSTRHSCC